MQTMVDLHVGSQINGVFILSNPSYWDVCSSVSLLTKLYKLVAVVFGSMVKVDGFKFDHMFDVILSK